MQQPMRIAPSILAADFARLGDEVALVAPHVDLLHIDVMDGHFVPNLSLGMPIIASLRRATDLFFDCHLMISNPDAYLEPLRDAGADMVTVHAEVFPDPTSIARQASDLGLGFGMVLNPPTPAEAIEPYLELCDFAVVMSVHPGFGGQTFIPEVLHKVASIRKSVDSQGLATEIEIDGGIDATTIRSAWDAGAEVFVAGSAVFHAPDPVVAVAEMRARVEQ
jgi:ribulose-phosphate 3-epimerase